MINIHLLIVVSILYFSSCNTKNDNDDIEIDIRTKFSYPINEAESIYELKDTFDAIRVEKLKESRESNQYDVFFNFFPNNFKEFKVYYGYDDYSGEGPLYSQYQNHITYFFEIEKKVGSDRFIGKLFGISIDGKWDADAIEFFQEKLSGVLVSEPDIFLKNINKMPDSIARGFWHFVFDGSTNNDLQNKDRFDRIYNVVSKLDKRQAALLKLEFESMYN